MKFFREIIYLLLTSLLLVSCDPAKLLVIKADSKSGSSVTVYTNNKIIPFGNKHDSTKMIIQVPLNDTTNKIFNFGIGNWPNDAIIDLAKNIDSIIFRGSTGKQALINKSELEVYLKKHRGGYAGSRLTIEAK
ncbi:hypothetical protein [Foetidibacter luteolus]|uniref:hypothetical protein n=1 Tax=Foetidibacter luteolus TaxID=2608880 RepID=UPI00129AB094|nr:hypothetical protein [Foetidibacter luteolus]